MRGVTEGVMVKKLKEWLERLLTPRKLAPAPIPVRARNRPR